MRRRKTKPTRELTTTTTHFVSFFIDTTLAAHDSSGAPPRYDDDPVNSALCREVVVRLHRRAHRSSWKSSAGRFEMLRHLHSRKRPLAILQHNGKETYKEERCSFCCWVAFFQFLPQLFSSARATTSVPSPIASRPSAQPLPHRLVRLLLLRRGWCVALDRRRRRR